MVKYLNVTINYLDVLIKINCLEIVNQNKKFNEHLIKILINSSTIDFN